MTFYLKPSAVKPVNQRTAGGVITRKEIETVEEHGVDTRRRRADDRCDEDAGAIGKWGALP